MAGAGVAREEGCVEVAVARGSTAPGASAELAERATQWYLEDTDALGLGRPDELPKASEVVPEIIRFISELIERDYASREGQVPDSPIPDEPNESYPDIEPRESVAARGLGALEMIRDTRLPLDGPDASIVVVCHGTIIRFTLSAIMGSEAPHIENAAANTVLVDRPGR